MPYWALVIGAVPVSILDAEIVSVGVVDPAELNSFSSKLPVEELCTTCHSILTHWFNEIEVVVIPLWKPAEKKITLPLVSTRTDEAAPEVPLTCTVADGLPVIYR